MVSCRNPLPLSQYILNVVSSELELGSSYLYKPYTNGKLMMSFVFCVL